METGCSEGLYSPDSHLSFELQLPAYCPITVTCMSSTMAILKHKNRQSLSDQNQLQCHGYN